MCIRDRWCLIKLLLVVPHLQQPNKAPRHCNVLTHILDRLFMSQRMLNHVMMLHCHQAKCDLLDLYNVAKEFASANQHRTEWTSLEASEVLRLSLGY